MESFKCILQGRLDFKNETSFNKAFALYEQRMEVYYKNEVAFKIEEVFIEDSFALIVPKTVTNLTRKFWKNTTGLLEYISQFALSGQVQCWMVESGKILKHFSVEPQGDKATIQAYQKGKKLAEEDGQEMTAIESLTKAIEQFDKHSQAYEKRGHTNLKLGNLKDAKYDFDKSLLIDPHNSRAYFGRGLLKMKAEDWLLATEDFQLAMKNSIAHQTIFWTCRRLKGDCHVILEDWEAAAKEFKFFVMRGFKEDDPNHKYIPAVYEKYIEALMSGGEDKLALEVVDKVLEEEKMKKKKKGVMLTRRGILGQRLGMKNFKADLVEAAALGSDEAHSLLEELG